MVESTAVVAQVVGDTGLQVDSVHTAEVAENPEDPHQRRCRDPARVEHMLL